MTKDPKIRCATPPTIRIPYRAAPPGRVLFFQEHDYADTVTRGTMIRMWQGPAQGCRAQAPGRAVRREAQKGVTSGARRAKGARIVFRPHPHNPNIRLPMIDASRPARQRRAPRPAHAGDGAQSGNLIRGLKHPTRRGSGSVIWCFFRGSTPYKPLKRSSTRAPPRGARLRPRPRAEGAGHRKFRTRNCAQRRGPGIANSGPGIAPSPSPGPRAGRASCFFDPLIPKKPNPQ